MWIRYIQIKNNATYTALEEEYRGIDLPEETD